MTGREGTSQGNRGAGQLGPQISEQEAQGPGRWGPSQPGGGSVHWGGTAGRGRGKGVRARDRDRGSCWVDRQVLGMSSRPALAPAPTRQVPPPAQRPGALSACAVHVTCVSGCVCTAPHAHGPAGWHHVQAAVGFRAHTCGGHPTPSIRGLSTPATLAGETAQVLMCPRGHPEQGGLSRSPGRPESGPPCRQGSAAL